MKSSCMHHSTAKWHKTQVPCDITFRCQITRCQQKQMWGWHAEICEKPERWRGSFSLLFLAINSESETSWGRLPSNRDNASRTGSEQTIGRTWVQNPKPPPSQALTPPPHPRRSPWEWSDVTLAYTITQTHTHSPSQQCLAKVNSSVTPHIPNDYHLHSSWTQRGEQRVGGSGLSKPFGWLGWKCWEDSRRMRTWEERRARAGGEWEKGRNNASNKPCKGSCHNRWWLLKCYNQQHYRQLMLDLINAEALLGTSC